MFAYLDNSATTKPYEEVIQALTDTMTLRYGNPSSLHKLGIDAEQDIKTCKSTILKSLNSPDGDILLMS